MTGEVANGDRNYAVAVAGFIALFSLSWWWIGARQYGDSPPEFHATMLTVCCSKYTGPRTKELLQLVDPEDMEEGPCSPEYGK